MSVINHIVKPFTTKVDRQYLNAIDFMQAFDIRFLLAYDEHIDDTLLIPSLSQALDVYPYLAGRLGVSDDGRLYVEANNEGVLVSIKSIESDFNYACEKFPSNTEMMNIFPSIENNTYGTTNPLLQVEIIKYRNKSFIFCVICHSLCDFPAFSDFLNCWSNFLNSNKQTEKPFFDRSSIKNIPSKSRKNDTFMSELIITEGSEQDINPEEEPPQDIFPTFEVGSFIFKESALEILKQHNKPDDVCVFTSDNISAYILSLIAQCQEEKIITFSKVYSLHSMIIDEENYFGNLNGTLSLDFKKEDFFDSDLYPIAKKIRGLTYEFMENHEDISSTFNFLEDLAKSNSLGKLSTEPGKTCVLFNDLSKIDFNKMKFGHTAPSWSDFMIPVIPLRYVMYTSSFGIESGIKIKITLPKNEMKEFIRISENYMTYIN